ncbi:MAG: amino acid adenylation domain-containing protein [Bdellovibrionales bacterium]
MKALLERSRSFGSRLAVGSSLADSRSWSYEELWQLADRVAGYLSRRENPEAPVALLGQKSPQAYATLLACLRLGVPLVPINPAWPVRRIEEVCRSVSTRSLLVESRYQHLLSSFLQNGVATQKSDAGVGYIIFTSGTTGEPKGIPVRQSNLSAFVSAMEKIFSFCPDDRWTQSFDLSFDLAVGEIVLCLMTGGTLFPLERAQLSLLTPYWEQSRPTIWGSTPSMLEFVMNRELLCGSEWKDLKWSFICGEPLRFSTAKRWKSRFPAAQLFNFYGPSEATVYATVQEIKGDEDWAQDSIVPIGRPLPGMNIRVVGQDGRDVPAGEVGELRLQGDQVTTGYWRNPEFSAERFVGRPPWYRTGDRVRVNSDGSLEFCGRSDRQIKFRGHRIELDEIETVARRFLPGAALTALAIPENQNPSALAVVIYGDSDLPVAALVREFRLTLPSYCQPIVYLSTDWPLNPSGKLDRQTLSERISKGIV